MKLNISDFTDKQAKGPTCTDLVRDQEAVGSSPTTPTI